MDFASWHDTVANEVRLTAEQGAMLAGSQGEAVALAMRVILAACRSLGASELVEVKSCHIDSCLYHGGVSLDFARRLLELGGQVRVPTTLNVGSVDLLHPATVLRRTEEERRIYKEGRALMDAYAALGTKQTWTCAPYQAVNRPPFGEHIAWAESNAIVFANSVLGARTERYGDFLDICAAITGLAPYGGLHTNEGRRGHIVFDCAGLPEAVFGSELFYPLLGYLVGERTTAGNPVITGLPATVTEDQLQALGAAAASGGGVALFHAVGITPEAPTLEAVCDLDELPRIVLDIGDLEAAREHLTTASRVRLDAVSVGTPHASIDQVRELAQHLRGRRVNERVQVFISTSRHVLALAEDEGLADLLQQAGVRIVVDTCTYVTSVLTDDVRTVATNSGKWAHYAPANLGVDVAIATMGECVESAVRGELVLWPLGEEGNPIDG